MLRKQETLQRIKEEKRKTDEKQHSYLRRRPALAVVTVTVRV
jgi:hypothetical protein